ncbi:single-stranded DNA-binding protein [Microbacterium neimengense]
MTSDLSPATTDSVEQLEQEGDVAADFLEGLLDIADIGGDLALDVRNDRAYVSIESDGDDSLRVLADPDTVSALQDLTRLAVQNRTGRFSRLILDVSGSRDARRRELEALVDRAASRLEDGASQASLPAMSSYERKVVHDIAAERGLVSESYGEGAQRHTVLRRA